MKSIFSISVIFLHLLSFGQWKSPFNEKTVAIDSTGGYRFLISGHFYGNSSNQTGYPANTLLAHLDWINSEKFTMVVCLGDLFMDVRNDIPKYEKSLFGKLNSPLVNAVGNHDLSGDVYEENFGNTFFKFQLGNTIHVVLDTELDDGDIKGEQLDMLKDVDREVKNGSINQVFIYGHRTIWEDTYAELEDVFPDNTESLLKNNYEDKVLPILTGIAEHTQLFCFAGSIGSAPASFFYFEDQQRSITYIATAIRGVPRDAVLIANVRGGEVTFENYSLTGEELMPLQDYNVDYWMANRGKVEFNWRLLPLYIKQTILSYAFWWGFLAALLLIAGIVFIKRRRNRKAV